MTANTVQLELAVGISIVSSSSSPISLLTRELLVLNVGEPASRLLVLKVNFIAGSGRTVRS